MKPLRLTRHAKTALRSLAADGSRPFGMDTGRWEEAVAELEDKGLARCMWASGRELYAASITPKGRHYLLQRPSLRNPPDWALLSAIAAAVGAAAGLAALFAACAP